MCIRDSLCLAVGDVFHADFYWSGTDLVGGKHAGCSGRHFRDNQGQVTFLPPVASFAGAKAFHVTEESRRQETLRGSYRTFNGMKRLQLGKKGIVSGK